MSPFLRRVLPDSTAGKQLHSSYVPFIPKGKEHFRRGLCMTYLQADVTYLLYHAHILVRQFLTSLLIQRCIKDGVHGSQLFSSVCSFVFFSLG